MAKPARKYTEAEFEALPRERRYQLLNRPKYLAHRRVEWAIKKGQLVRQPCERCGDANAQAHHDDYSRPLDVMWLCAAHHIERHQEIDPDHSKWKPNRKLRGPRTHCPKGHEYTPENRMNGATERRCRICSQEADRRKYPLRKERGYYG